MTKRTAGTQAEVKQGEVVDTPAEPVTQTQATVVAAPQEQTQALARAMNPMELLTLAVQNKADMATLEKLMDLRDRDQANAARLAYSTAIVNFQAICPTVVRTGYNERFDNQYPQWSSAHVQIKPSLIQCQLAVTHGMSQDEKGVITVVAECRHGPSGHIETNKLSAPPDRLQSREGKAVRTELQSIKSTITYLECVTAFALLGLNSRDRGKDEKIDPAVERAIDRDDDDGNAAGAGKERREEKPKSSELLDADERQAKKEFAAECHRLVGGKTQLAQEELRDLLAQARGLSGHENVKECTKWLKDKRIVKATDGRWVIEAESPQSQPQGEEAPEGELFGDGGPAETRWECEKCLARYKVLPAGGKCTAEKAGGKVCGGTVVKTME